MSSKKILYYIFILPFLYYLLFYNASPKELDGFIKYYTIYKPNAYSEEYKQRYINERINAYYLYKNIYNVRLHKNYLDKNIENNYFLGLYNNVIQRENFLYENDMNKVYSQYINAGGCEIPKKDIENPDFQKLLDRKFVLTCK